MEQSPLREYYEALTAPMVSNLGAEVLVRHLNNVKTVQGNYGCPDYQDYISKTDSYIVRTV